MEGNCPFCQPESQVIIQRFQHCYAIRDRFPVSPGHILVIPYEHTLDWFTASEDVRLDIMKSVQILKEHLDSQFAPGGYNIGMNCGELAGQTVMHLHLHLIPRYSGDMADPRGGVRGVIPSKQKYS